MTDPIKKFESKYIHIAGSSNPHTDLPLIEYAHDIIRMLTGSILLRAGGLVLGVGPEPMPANATRKNQSLVFDWTILETALECIKDGSCKWSAQTAPLIIVGSEKSISEIPSDRQALWRDLLDSKLLRLEYIMPGARSGAMIREKQALYGDVLVILGGGTGVEHLSDLYLQKRRPVIPFDIQLGASRADGMGGAYAINRLAKADPGHYFRLEPSLTGQENAYLASISARSASTASKEVAEKMVELLVTLAPPDAFYVRLLNDTHSDFPEVENFFRNVVDPVVKSFGYNRLEMGTDPARRGFINVDIFEGLTFSPVVIADVTGLRPNCFIELGYALGNGNKLLVTALQGTDLPFDQNAIPCHFWMPSKPNNDRIEELTDFWLKNINRRRIVS